MRLVRADLWVNWKSSRSWMLLMALVTCTTLFMKAILRLMSYGQRKNVNKNLFAKDLTRALSHALLS